MTESLDPAYVIKHVVADLERVRALIQHEAEKSRRWELTDPGQVVISDDHLNAVVNRLDEVRNDALDAVTASELEGAAT